MDTFSWNFGIRHEAPYEKMIYNITGKYCGIDDIWGIVCNYVVYNGIGIISHSRRLIN